MIAQEDDSVPFVSDESFSSYVAHMHSSDVVVIWRKTYECMESDEFLENKQYVVFSREEQSAFDSGIHFVKNTEEFYAFCKEHSFQNILVSWWMEINTLFLEQNLIDTIIVDIEPAILWKGKKIFWEKELFYDMELIDVNHVSQNTIQLEYRIKK